MDKKVGALLRAAIMVSDLDRSIEFYRDILGLRETYFAGNIEDAVVGKLLGLADLQSSRCVILKAEGPALGMIGLFEIPKADTDELTGVAPGPGQICLVFNHPDLEELLARLEIAGRDIVCPPTSLRVSDEIESLEMTFRDPDGVIINCIQREP